MTRGLCEALDGVIARPDVLAFDAARNVAQLLVLPGLDRLLAVMAVHGGATGPPELRHAIDRLRRERDRALAQSSLVNFYGSDREFAALALHLEGLEWNAVPVAKPEEPEARPETHETVIGFMDALGECRYADEASEVAARRTRLSAPVASVLRATLDWLFGDVEHRAPLRVSEDAAVVEVECRGVDPEGLLPAHEVIASVGGSLSPVPGGARGAWLLRLPATAERESFLMLQQSDLRLALPWVNVLRIQMETAADEPLGAPPLAPLRPLTGARHGRPVVTVGLGLRRGSLAVDRLVWRLAAEPCKTTDAIPAGASRAVAADDGERFWVIDVAQLMRYVPLPPLHETPEPRESPAPKSRVKPAVKPALKPAAADALPPRLILLRAESVEPTNATPMPKGAPATPATPATPAPTASRPPTHPTKRPFASVRPAAPPPNPSPGHGRRALIAEDSFMARIFLMRQLQILGYHVHSVGTARELREVLPSGEWALVCVDTDLPDARGAELLRDVSDSQLDRTEPAVVVALVRDGADQEQAAAGGVHRVLLKPFSQHEVRAMLDRAGLPVAEIR
jgi:CheY-like chemotaxis protein